MAKIELTQRDLDILTAIREIRQEYQACTAAAVAVRLHLSRPWVFELLHGMHDRGLVTWNAEMPGSLRALVNRLGVPIKQAASTPATSPH